MGDKVHKPSRRMKKKITLAPMKETKLPKPRSRKGISLLTLKTLIEVTKTGIVLAVVERNKRVDLEVSEEVQSLIEEYRDIFPNDLHSGLPRRIFNIT